jgi:hypothetical protein
MPVATPAAGCWGKLLITDDSLDRQHCLDQCSHSCVANVPLVLSQPSVSFMRSLVLSWAHRFDEALPGVA